MNEYSDFETKENIDVLAEEYQEAMAEEGRAENSGAPYEDYSRRETAPAKKKKKRRKKHYFLRFCIFCAVVAGLIIFLRSDFFTVKTFEVEGNRYYTPAQIVEMSGLTTGGNIFTDIKARPAKQTLLEDPYVKSVEIKRQLPGTVKIILDERVEYAAVPYGGQYVLIDNEGTVLRVMDQEPTLPILGGMTLIETIPGMALSVEQSYLLTDTLQLLSVMEENDIYFKRIDFSTVVIRAYIYDNMYCEGTPSNITNNMGSLQKLLQELYQQGITRGVIKVGSDNYLSFSPDYE